MAEIFQAGTRCCVSATKALPLTGNGIICAVLFHLFVQISHLLNLVACLFFSLLLFVFFFFGLAQIAAQKQSLVCLSLYVYVENCLCPKGQRAVGEERTIYKFFFIKTLWQKLKLHFFFFIFGCTLKYCTNSSKFNLFIKNVVLEARNTCHCVAHILGECFAISLQVLCGGRTDNWQTSTAKVNFIVEGRVSLSTALRTRRAAAGKFWFLQRLG